MCGFTGIISSQMLQAADAAFMQFTLSDLHRRGPDSQQIWNSEDGKVTFGFARLAIRDVSTMGSQPMQSKSGRWVMMYNGETYNTQEVIEWSGLDVHTLQSTSDTGALQIVAYLSL